MTETPNPLLIPDILSIILLDIDVVDLLICRRVCHTWKRTIELTPALRWKTWICSPGKPLLVTPPASIRDMYSGPCGFQSVPKALKSHSWGRKYELNPIAIGLFVYCWRQIMTLSIPPHSQRKDWRLSSKIKLGEKYYNSILSDIEQKVVQIQSYQPNQDCKIDTIPSVAGPSSSLVRPHTGLIGVKFTPSRAWRAADWNLKGAGKCDVGALARRLLFLCLRSDPRTDADQWQFNSWQIFRNILMSSANSIAENVFEIGVTLESTFNGLPGAVQDTTYKFGLNTAEPFEVTTSGP
ncbi:hypothetical protein ABW19_dt0203042 [Dactylella cylindrospora]|nr:hypothetical protein ABW19_dt0203042 [Dactylella cylindrospora]